MNYHLQCLIKANSHLENTTSRRKECYLSHVLFDLEITENVKTELNKDVVLNMN